MKRERWSNILTDANIVETEGKIRQTKLMTTKFSLCEAPSEVNIPSSLCFTISFCFVDLETNKIWLYVGLAFNFIGFRIRPFWSFNTPVEWIFSLTFQCWNIYTKIYLFLNPLTTTARSYTFLTAQSLGITRYPLYSHSSLAHQT